MSKKPRKAPVLGTWGGEAPAEPPKAEPVEAVTLPIPPPKRPQSAAGEGVPVCDDLCAIREALWCRFESFSKLPLGSTLHTVTGEGQRLDWTTSRAGHAKALADGVPCLVWGEAVMIGAAVEAGRFRSRDLARVVERRLLFPRERLSSDAVWDGARPRPGSLGIGEGFYRLGVSAIGVTVHE